jgi:hypothetical protein
MPEIKRRSVRRICPEGARYEIAHAFQKDSELLEAPTTLKKVAICNCEMSQWLGPIFEQF